MSFRPMLRVPEFPSKSSGFQCHKKKKQTERINSRITKCIRREETLHIAREMQEEDVATHRKRMAQILRYIASMHTTLYDQDNLKFCQSKTRPNSADFFADDPEVLFTTDSFRHLLGLHQDRAVFETPPFTFYAAAADTRKRSLHTLLKGGPGKTCWLRITRLTASKIARRPVITEKVRPYLEAWAKGSSNSDEKHHTNNNNSLNRWLSSIENLEAAPKLAPGSRHATQVQQFLRRMKKYLRQKAFLDLVEPIYNRLFEWQQQEVHNAELVWGLGHARMLMEDGTLVNGPLLEVLLEVELARDGALILRPREHTGVSLNRHVVTGLGAHNGTLVAQLYKDVAELEPAHLSPAQPTTYAKLLQRMAVELSPGGVYQNSDDANPVADPHRLVVTEAWCVYQRTKPSSVWARDATAFADQLLALHNNGGRAMVNTKTPLTLPLAAWAFTHGPSTLDQIQEMNASQGFLWDKVRRWMPSSWGYRGGTVERPLFPLPTSEAQNRIADLLLQGHPAVVCEGPPGTGKSHSIANLICAYLCRGKRVLCTSKQAPALAVLRSRLPPTVQELCVDVSRSELAGLQQLQTTVERLANRVACASTVMQTEKCDFLLKTIAQHEGQLADIDVQLTKQSDKIRKLVQEPRGQEFVDHSLRLINDAPWLVSTVADWSPSKVRALCDRVGSLVVPPGDAIRQVSGFVVPPSDALISRVAAEAGNVFSVVKNAIKSKAAGVPVLGSATGLDHRLEELEQSLGLLRLNENQPGTIAEWKIVLHGLQHAKSLHAFEEDVWQKHEREHQWPRRQFIGSIDELAEVHELFVRAAQLKQLSRKLNVDGETKRAVECRALDVRRGMIAKRLQGLAEDLVDATVLTELSKSFSTDAQSALIRFAQIAGKAKFSRASQPSKMTQRQRRRRQEYLDAFDKCCRFIPCWILTTSQISDYLPAECLFDLVILDEASQSDVTALPGMLRGKQWLIVGDGKQVSPTEAFVSEEQIDTLRAALPSSPVEDSLLPGQSFFDLCAQAFPTGRVVLSEHFRCAEEIIKFSNDQFYDGRLVPLRLPTKSERLAPSLVDIKVEGVKKGKTNEKEAEEIVRLIQDFTNEEHQTTCPRSIGVISLMGDEQSRLIRGRLLDAIEPHLMARHNVLVGDPPTFQGAERDVIYLSMVCSPGSVPTQNQLMHIQRANVAMSRARDRCVLVRSIDLHEVSNDSDIKIPIIEFFATQRKDSQADTRLQDEISGHGTSDSKILVRNEFSKLMKDRGYSVRSMGVVWEGGVAIEQDASDTRAALFVDCAGETHHEWKLSYCQQKAIERVGWNCMRIDALSLLANPEGCLSQVAHFLSSVGIQEPNDAKIVHDDLDFEEVMDDKEDGSHDSGQHRAHPDRMEPDSEDEHDDDEGPRNDAEVVVVSSDEQSIVVQSKVRAHPEAVVSEKVETEVTVDPSNFGQVVDLSFLKRKGGGGAKGNLSDVSSHDEKESKPSPAPSNSESSDGEFSGGQSSHRRKKRRRYKRLDKYSRDGRWYPGTAKEADRGEEEKEWHDTDSDIPKAEVQENKQEG